MSVIPITVFFSLGLVLVFVALFWREHRRRRFASAERDSLLPLADETAHVIPGRGEAHGAHDHHAGCGCRSGRHRPCAHCRESRPS